MIKRFFSQELAQLRGRWVLCKLVVWLWVSNFIVIARACVGNAFSFFFFSFFLLHRPCIWVTVTLFFFSASGSRAFFFFLSFVCNAYLGCGGHGCIELRVELRRHGGGPFIT